MENNNIVRALGITKDIWDSLPSEYKQKIMKAVTDRQMDVATKLLASAVKGNPDPTKKYDPVARATRDNYTTDFFGGKHWSPEGFVKLCRMQGISGELWTHSTLSPVLKLFVQNAKDMEEPKLDALLRSFAEAIGFNEASLRRHYFSIKRGFEDVFLVHEAQKAEKRRKLEDLAEEAESEAPEEEDEIEESGEDEE